MTPYELNLAIETFLERQEQEQEEKVTLVWLGEYYHRIKRLPSLNEILQKKGVAKKMSDQQMYEVVKALNSKLGGKIQ